MRKGFLYIFFSHTDISSKIQIFLVIYTDFVLDQSGRSAHDWLSKASVVNWLTELVREGQQAKP